MTVMSSEKGRDIDFIVSATQWHYLVDKIVKLRVAGRVGYNLSASSLTLESSLQDAGSTPFQR